jgi:DNA-binding PadR family transcriptional regulator
MVQISIAWQKLVEERKIGFSHECILLSLIQGESYGFEIQKNILDASDGYANLNVGTIYPTLNQLEEWELVTRREENNKLAQRKGKKRVYYKITDKGLTIVNYLEKMRVKIKNKDLVYNPI